MNKFLHITFNAIILYVLLYVSKIDALKNQISGDTGGNW